MTSCLIGCCGWREARARYFEHFPVVELQDTFYEPPSVALAEKWKSQAPPGFVFGMKAWQLITHTASSPTYRRLKSKLSEQERDLVGSFRPTEQVWLAWERTAAIAHAVAAEIVLFQCPSSFLPSRENIRNLREFLARVGSTPFRLAWEPRGKWQNELISEICAEFHLIHCVDPFQAEQVEHSPIYWRLHGRKGYSYRYSDEELADLAARVHASDSRGPAYVLFNNVWMREDALRFQQLMREKEVS